MFGMKFSNLSCLAGSNILGSVWISNEVPSQVSGWSGC